jgi:hypothetical protein
MLVAAMEAGAAFLSLCPSALCCGSWSPFSCLSVLCLALNLAFLCPVSCSKPGITHAHLSYLIP